MIVSPSVCPRVIMSCEFNACVGMSVHRCEVTTCISM